MNFFSGKTKAQLDTVQQSNASIRGQISQKENELAALNNEIQACMANTQGLENFMMTEQQNKANVDAETARLMQERAAAQNDVAELRQRVAQAQAAAQEGQREQETLFAELARFEGMLKNEHESAQKATEVAQRETSSLRMEQEKERMQWQTTKQAHENLRQQADLGSQQASEAQAQLETLKREHAAAREALQELRWAYDRLREEHSTSEKSLEEEQQKCLKLEAQLAELDIQVQSATSVKQELEVVSQGRQAALAAVSAEVDQKKAVLHEELTSFERQFNEAKAQRERFLGETSQVRDALGTFLPEHFALQTKHAEKQRELENVRRQHETLQWEHHKVNRDLESLAKSYDVGCLPSVSPKAPP